MQKIDSFIKKLQNIMIMIAGIMIMFSTILAAINAILRYIAGMGFVWTEELTTYLIVIAIFFSVSFLEYNEGQLSIDIVSAILKNKVANAILRCIRLVVTAACVLMLTYYGVLATQKAFMRGTVTYVLQIPRAWLYGCITASMIITIVGIVAAILFKGRKEDSETNVG